MKKPYLLCFFVFLLPIMGCFGNVNAEQILLANLSDVTAQSSEEELGTVVFTLLEAISGAEVDTVVDEEGFGVVRYGFGYEPSSLERAQNNLPPGFLDALNCHSATKLLLEKAPAGSTLMEEKRGSATWCIVNVPFSNLLQLAEHYEAIFNTAIYAPELEIGARSGLQGDAQNEDSSAAEPLIRLQCLELVDGLFYQQFAIDEAALGQDDADLMEVFGINLQWRLSMPGEIRSHNAPAKLTFPLAWNLLDSPETLSVNMQPEDACPSSRLKLLLEFTSTDTTLASLTIPISRTADDLEQNEEVRQILSEQGWLTQIEGSANHAPRIVALRQFNQRELGQVLKSIPGVEGTAQVVRQMSPQAEPAKAGETSSLASVDLPTSVRIDLNLSKFANTWAQLMPELHPTAFELDIDSLRTVSNLEGQWSDSVLPYLLWNSEDDTVERELALTLTSDNFLPLADGAAETAGETATETAGETGAETAADLENEETAVAEEIAATVDASIDEEVAEADSATASEQGEGLVASRLPERTIATRMTEENMQPLSVRVSQALDEEDDQTNEDGQANEDDSDVESTTAPSQTLGPTPTPEPTAEPTAEPTSTPTNTPTPEPNLEPTEVADSTKTVSSVRIALGNEADDEDAQSSKENRSALTVAALVQSASSAPKTIGSLASAELAAGEDEAGQTVGDLLQSGPTTSDEEADSVKTISDLIAPSEDEQSGDADTSEVVEVEEQAEEAEKTEEVEVEEQASIALPAQETADAASAEPSAEPTDGQPTCTVVIEWLNLRPGPGLEYGEPIAPLPQGTQLIVLSQDPSGFWVEVMTEEPSFQGWVSLLPEFVSCSGDLSATPQIDLATFEPIDTNRLPTTTTATTTTATAASGQATPAVKGLSDKD